MGVIEILEGLPSFFKMIDVSAFFWGYSDPIMGYYGKHTIFPTAMGDFPHWFTGFRGISDILYSYDFVNTGNMNGNI